jgi:hypothetical protein
MGTARPRRNYVLWSTAGKVRDMEVSVQLARAPSHLLHLCYASGQGVRRMHQFHNCSRRRGQRHAEAIFRDKGHKSQPRGGSCKQLNKF